MGATRKLQGEIDRVLKKVQEGVDVFDSIWNKVYDTENANQKEKFEADLKKEIKKLQRYRDQIKSWIQSSEIKDKKALLDARKSIEREMERFKVCEKETKTKAFSKEGLGQLPKPDPREKAKGESRDWLNNMVSELESQIDTFEAELEGLSVKKGKTRPPRLTHLEDSIGRHKAHITKLELILRLLDNDELSPEEVNDVKEFVEDYVERNQDDFEEFADVDELYNSLPLDKIEALENLDAVPSIASSVIVKEKAAVAAASGAAATNSVTLKQPILAPGTQQTVVSNSSAASIGVVQQLPPSPQLDEESGSSPVGNIVIQSTTSGVISISGTSAGSPGLVPAAGGNLLVARGLAGASSLVLPINDVRGAPKSVAMPSSAVNIGAGLKEEEPLNLLDHRVAPGVIEVGFTRGLGRGAVSSNLVSLESSSLNAMALGAATLSTSAVGVSSGPIIVSTVADSIKRTELIGDDERVTSGGLSQQLASSLSMQNRTFLQPSTKPADASGIADANSATEGGVIGGRIYSPVASGGQWRPQTANALQTSTESFLVRTEIAPDQKQKFLQRLQKAHQQQQTATLLSSSQQFSQMTGTSQKPQQVLPSQQTALMQQLQLLNQQQQTPLVQTSQNVIQQQQQVGLQLGVQASGISTATLQNPQQSQLAAASSHQFHQQLLAVTKEADSTPNKEQQSQENVPDETSVFPRRILLNDDDIKSSDTFEAPIGGPGTLSEFNQLPRDSDLTPGQPLQPSQSFAGPGVIGRRSMDLGAIGDNVTTSPASGHSQLYNLQMLEAAYHKIPLPKDSERLRKYVPRHPAVTPSSYPQVPAQIIDNPALWERLDTDALFFAFYYQQGTYQQYLAARELKRQSWRYHKKYNTWFQRHEEPKVTTDEYEQGTYVYFDFHIVHDDFQQGWCQRIKTEFTFEYSYLEDELT